MSAPSLPPGGDLAAPHCWHLVSQSQQSAGWVSACSWWSKERFCPLPLQDEYNNHTGTELGGRVLAKIKSPGEEDIEVPQFQGKVEFPLERGSARIVSVAAARARLCSRAAPLAGLQLLQGLARGRAAGDVWCLKHGSAVIRAFCCLFVALEPGAGREQPWKGQH